jgi:predicted DCC family thiol-disulfide oxidoreductase YuxK
MATLIFDGDCGFCTTSAGWARRIAPDVETVAWQLTDLDAWGVAPEAAAAEVQFVDDAGHVSAGAMAVAHLLIAAGGVLALLGRFIELPVVRVLAAWVYQLVAANRYRLPGGTPACRVTS